MVRPAQRLAANLWEDTPWPRQGVRPVLTATWKESTIRRAWGVTGGWRKWQCDNHSPAIGSVAGGLIVLGVGVYAHGGGLAGYTHHHREVSDSQISLLAGGLSDMLAAAVITHCAIVPAMTDRPHDRGAVS
jgi:hypothetical protein